MTTIEDNTNNEDLLKEKDELIKEKDEQIEQLKQELSKEIEKGEDQLR